MDVGCIAIYDPMYLSLRSAMTSTKPRNRVTSQAS
jgi:hypothetical protein